MSFFFCSLPVSLNELNEVGKKKWNRHQFYQDASIGSFVEKLMPALLCGHITVVTYVRKYCKMK